MSVVDLRGASTGDAAGLRALAAALRSGARALARDPDELTAPVLAAAADVLDDVAAAMRATVDPGARPALEARLVTGLHEPLHRLAVLRGSPAPGTD